MTEPEDEMILLDNGNFARLIEIRNLNTTYRVIVENDEPFQFGGALMVIGDRVMVTGGFLSRSAFAKELEKMAAELRAADSLEQKRKADQS